MLCPFSQKRRLRANTSPPAKKHDSPLFKEHKLVSFVRFKAVFRKTGGKIKIALEDFERIVIEWNSQLFRFFFLS
jgi:hypothetical protein